MIRIKSLGLAAFAVCALALASCGSVTQSNDSKIAQQQEQQLAGGEAAWNRRAIEPPPAKVLSSVSTGHCGEGTMERRDREAIEPPPPPVRGEDREMVAKNIRQALISSLSDTGAIDRAADIILSALSQSPAREKASKLPPPDGGGVEPQCGYCAARFWTRWELAEHVYESHGGPKPNHLETPVSLAQSPARDGGVSEAFLAGYGAGLCGNPILTDDDCEGDGGQAEAALGLYLAALTPKEGES